MYKWGTEGEGTCQISVIFLENIITSIMLLHTALAVFASYVAKLNMLAKIHQKY